MINHWRSLNRSNRLGASKNIFIYLCCTLPMAFMDKMKQGKAKENEIATPFTKGVIWGLDLHKIARLRAFFGYP